MCTTAETKTTTTLLQRERGVGVATEAKEEEAELSFRLKIAEDGNVDGESTKTDTGRRRRHHDLLLGRRTEITAVVEERKQ